MEPLEVWYTLQWTDKKCSSFFQHFTKQLIYLDRWFWGLSENKTFFLEKLLELGPKKSCHLRDFWSYFSSKGSPVPQAHPTREDATSQTYAENIPDFY